MPEHLRVAGGVVAKDCIAESEAAQYDALKRGVLAEEARKEQDERERRVSAGLPAELNREEKKQQKRIERERREEAARQRKAGLRKRDKGGEERGKQNGKRVLGMLCFGS